MKFTALKAVIGLVVAVAGIGGAAYATGVIQKPSAGLVDRGDWVLDDEIKVESSAYVHNPNPLTLNVSSLEARYRLKMNGIRLAKGKKSGLYIPENENRTLKFRTRLKTENIPKWWVSHLRNEEESALEVPIKASLKIGPLPLSFSGYSYTDTISTDVEGILSESLSKLEGTYSRQLGPDVGLEANNFKIEIVDAGARFGKINARYTELVIPLEIKNVNNYAIPTPQLTGNLKMNGVKIAEFTANNVETSSDTNIPAGETREVTIRAKMSNQNIDEWFESHVRKREKTDAELNIFLGFDIGGTSIQIPSDNGMTCRFSFATKILADKKADAEGFKGCSGIVQSDGSSDDSSDGGLLGDDSSDSENSTDFNDSFSGLL